MHACVCLCVAGIGTDHFQNCVLTVPLYVRRKEGQGIDHTMEPFVSHLSVFSRDLCVYSMCVCVCVL